MSGRRIGSVLVGLVCVLMAAPEARVRDDEMTARFTRQIDQLIAFFQPGGTRVPAPAVADAMIAAKARNHAFRLEALLRLYERSQPDLEKYRRKVKALEDGLGAYGFAVDARNYAEESFKKENAARPPDPARTAAQASVLASLEKDRAAAYTVFTQLIEKSTLPADLPRLRSTIVSKFSRWTPAREMNFVTGELNRTLRTVRDSRLDFNKLEEGIHEFRRELRWFPVLIDALDGLVVLRTDPPGSCPVRELERLADSPAAKHRYATPALAHPSPRPCEISRCLLWGTVQTVTGLGDLKDEAQGNSAIAEALDDDLFVAAKKDITPQEIARAKSIRDDLFASRTLETLMTQLSACKQ